MARLVNNSFRQIHQAATLAINGLAALSETSNVVAHRFVCSEPCCVQLRIAAAQIESVKAFWKLFLLNWAKLDNLRASVDEQIKIVLVVETERVIASDTDSQSSIKRLSFLLSSVFYLDWL